LSNVSHFTSETETLITPKSGEMQTNILIRKKKDMKLIFESSLDWKNFYDENDKLSPIIIMKGIPS
jgi:hypothetical protein